MPSIVESMNQADAVRFARDWAKTAAVKFDAIFVSAYAGELVGGVSLPAYLVRLDTLLPEPANIVVLVSPPLLVLALEELVQEGPTAPFVDAALLGDPEAPFKCVALRATVKKSVCLSRQCARERTSPQAKPRPIHGLCARGDGVEKPQCAQGALVRLSLGSWLPPSAHSVISYGGGGMMYHGGSSGKAKKPVNSAELTNSN